MTGRLPSGNSFFVVLVHGEMTGYPHSTEERNETLRPHKDVDAETTPHKQASKLWWGLQDSSEGRDLLAGTPTRKPCRHVGVVEQDQD